ncbi:MAG: DUF1275 domain-containing protein [Lachnospiraceae bacterium]|jgi:uncharacterized membrane protein YoaK (UPF0700 family)|nr:DUF1275 domain-containing protein [Lachnospiraceae bacterium]
MDRDRQNLYLHSAMCFIGGFLGAYALLVRAENFGSAQTSNMIMIVSSIVGRNFSALFIRILGLFIYTGAMALTVLLQKKSRVNMQKYCIAADLAGMLLLSLIPSGVDPFLGLYPLFFMTATQWCVFHGIDGYNSSTIFSTNNLKQAITSFMAYLIDGDEEMHKKARFFGNSLLWYHIGVAASAAAVTALGVPAILCCIPVGAISWYLVCRDEGEETEGALETVAEAVSKAEKGIA